MNFSLNDIENWLPGYFSGDLAEEERAVVDTWRQHSPENEKIFEEARRAWDAIPLLREMEQFNSFEALKKINPRLKHPSGYRWLTYLQRAAAILIFPLLVYAGWLTFKNQDVVRQQADVVWQTIQTPPGFKSCFQLPDGSLVWLNSASSVTFPLTFANNARQVKVTGEAFFDVQENQDWPFSVSLGKINVKVLGTRFNVINYKNEARTEIILESGKVELQTETTSRPRILAEMKPGELARFNKKDNSVALKKVDTDKYCSWINGKLIFRDDPMDEVVRKLNRWFNVDIEVADPAIREYIYTASFQDESLDQILELLTISAPISYQVIQREMQGDQFSAKRIILRKR